MRKILLSFLISTYSYINSQPCTPSAQNLAETPFIKSSVSNMGDLWADKALSSGGLEYPKRTLSEISAGVTPIYPIFAGGIWLSSKNGSQINHSVMRYRSPISKMHFFPGPIKLSSGTVDPQSCQVFDNVWRMQKSIIKTHINKWATGILPIPNISPEILNWPAKGNKQYTTVPITDDMAPFADVNGNGIYDPEYGDYPIIKGDESFFSVFNDISSGRLDSPNKPIGVEVHLMTNTFYDDRLNSLGTALFQDCKIIKKTPNDANEFIFSLFVDSDLGNFRDDYIGCDTPSNSGYTYNGDDFDESTSVRGYLANPPILMTSFINAKMATFSYHINSVSSPLSDPNTAIEYRNFMEGKNRIGGDFTVSPNAITSGFPTTKFCFYGNPSSGSEWSMVSQNYTPTDLRYNLSTDQSTLSYNQPREISFVTYFHKFATSSFKPNITDLVIPSLTKIKNYYRDSINKCDINISAQITSDTNGLKKGKITISNITGATAPYSVRWSSNETTESISGKDSGTYRIALVDANNCLFSRSFFIPRVKTGAGSIMEDFPNNIILHPNPTSDFISIRFLGLDNFLSSREVEKKLILTNTLGQQLDPTIEVTKEGYILDLRHLSSGIYLLQLRDKNDQILKTERIVISK